MTLTAPIIRYGNLPYEGGQTMLYDVGRLSIAAVRWPQPFMTESQ